MAEKTSLSLRVKNWGRGDISHPCLPPNCVYCPHHKLYYAKINDTVFFVTIFLLFSNASWAYLVSCNWFLLFSIVFGSLVGPLGLWWLAPGHCPNAHRISPPLLISRIFLYYSDKNTTQVRWLPDLKAMDVKYSPFFF